MKRKIFGGSNMLGVMIAMGLILLLVAAWSAGGLGFLFGEKKPNTRPDKVGETVVGRSFARAKDDVCRSNLSQIRISLQAADPTEDEHPASLEALNLPKETIVCPIDKKPYDYDPATATVKCKHLGHEKY